MSGSNSNKKYDFSGKVALVTGSSSGIGAAIALQFAQFGAQVAVHGRDVQMLDKVAKQIEQESGHNPLQIVGDLCDPTVPEKLVNETLAKFNRLDILVNNAGAGTPHDKLSDPNFMEAYDKTMFCNTRSAVHLIHLAAPHLEKTKGNIINISSIAGTRPFSLIYSTSKAALDMVTKCCAQELSPKGIRVNTISPGPVVTRFGRSLGMGETMYEKVAHHLKEYTLMDFIPYPEEIANLASFLASDDARNITGSIMISDTGSILRRPKPHLSAHVVQNSGCSEKCSGCPCSKKD